MAKIYEDTNGNRYKVEAGNDGYYYVVMQDRENFRGWYRLPASVLRAEKDAAELDLECLADRLGLKEVVCDL